MYSRTRFSCKQFTLQSVSLHFERCTASPHNAIWCFFFQFPVSDSYSFLFNGNTVECLTDDCLHHAERILWAHSRPALTDNCKQHEMRQLSQCAEITSWYSLLSIQTYYRHRQPYAGDRLCSLRELVVVMMMMMMMMMMYVVVVVVVLLQPVLLILAVVVLLGIVAVLLLQLVVLILLLVVVVVVVV